MHPGQADGRKTTPIPTLGGPDRPSEGEAWRTPRYSMSRTPSGGPCPEESASEAEGFDLKWTVRISFFAPFRMGNRS